MPKDYRARLANLTCWALDDLLDDGPKARALLAEMLAWTDREAADAAKSYDKPRQARLAQLNHLVARLALHLADAERITLDARHGEYHGDRDLSAKGPNRAAATTP